MNPERSASQETLGPGFNEKAREVRQEIGDRLRWIRAHHPEGPFSLEALAARSKIAKRRLASAESTDGANLTIETLVKIAHSLDIDRVAYFIDSQVFEDVNAQLALLREFQTRNVSSVALRTSHAPDIPPSTRAQLQKALMGIVASLDGASEDDTGQR
ncbi:helix-turn-helix domain-containing protein [Streptomyces sp. NPDC021218]|uniref:helix-turn-helix domain-containing protein n=1 Tax=Streptomyces sp. NPDC021218 TaxID=3365119 RepID=UPI003789A587